MLQECLAYIFVLAAIVRYEISCAVISPWFGNQVTRFGGGTTGVLTLILQCHWAMAEKQRQCSGHLLPKETTELQSYEAFLSSHNFGDCKNY